MYEADELLVAMAYDGDGIRVFQLNYNLHTDEDWKANSGNGNDNNKDNSGSGDNSSDSSSTNSSSNGSGLRSKEKCDRCHHDNKPIGEGTLLFSPECGAINSRTELADGQKIANINALRNDKDHEGRGCISKLVRLMEQYAADTGYSTITIGVEARESRNLAIYLHWGYDLFVRSEIEEGVLILYYSKSLKAIESN